jgi:hypothetical protein
MTDLLPYALPAVAGLLALLLAPAYSAAELAIRELSGR